MEGEGEKEKGEKEERPSKESKKGAVTGVVKRVGEKKMKGPQKMDTADYNSLNVLQKSNIFSWTYCTVSVPSVY